MIDAKEIKHRLSGDWESVLRALAPALNEALDKNGKHSPCPVHGGKDGFRMFNDFRESGGGICNSCGSFSDGFALLMWANDWSFKHTIEALRAYLGEGYAMPTTTNKKPFKQPKIKPNDNAQRSVDAVIAMSKRINWPVAKYLQNRGLTGIAEKIPADIRAVDSLEYWEDGKLLGSYPAMICLVRNIAGDVITIHRTYLTEYGYKAKVSSPKKIMTSRLSGTTSGCSIHLYKPKKKLAICEGVETALAAYLDCGYPVWAAMSTTLMEKVVIPSSVEEVLVLGDKDRSGAGQRSAKVLAHRLLKENKNLTVKMSIPSNDIPEGASSIDWLDVYNLDKKARL